MTPQTIEDAARNRYNGTGDTFFNTDDFLDSIYQAEQELAAEANIIENTYTTTTVAGTQDYDYPANTISIKRVTYNGAKLQPIDMRDDDVMSLSNSADTTQGTPQFYYIWNNTISLRPIPDDALTLKIYSYDMPQAVTASSTLEIPVIFHMAIVDFVLAQMYAKDKDFAAYDKFMLRWQAHVERAKKWARKRKRGDSFASVKDEDSLAINLLGAI